MAEPPSTMVISSMGSVSRSSLATMDPMMPLPTMSTPVRLVLMASS